MHPHNVRIDSLRSTSIFTARVQKFLNSDHVQLEVFVFDPRDSTAVKGGPYFLPMSIYSFANLDARDFELYLRRQLSAWHKIVEAATWCDGKRNKGQDR